jgi:hypothetical protein
MSNIVPLTAGAQLPAYLKSAPALDVNSTVVVAPPFPSLSIKGKRFTVVRDGIKNVLMKPKTDPAAEDEVAQYVEVVVLRANPNSRTFYGKEYDPDTGSEGIVPDCYTMDGVAPSPQAGNKQSEKCAICPKNVWGEGKGGKGTACSANIRLAVATPDKLSDPYLLRAPPASIKPFKEVIKLAKQRNLQYNMLVLRVGFDIEAESPKLTFKPIGLLDDASYSVAVAAFDDEKVHAIVGLVDEPRAATTEATASGVEVDELDAAIAARAAVQQASKAPQATKPEVHSELPAATPAKPAKAAAPKAAKATSAVKPDPAPATPAAADGDDLMGDLDALLGGRDD